MNPQSKQREQTPNERRLEVRRVFHEDGASEVLLQELSYSAGIGWFPQKTIRLDGDQVDSLLRQLCCERSSGCPKDLSHAERFDDAPTQPVPQMPEIIQFRERLGS